MTKTYFMPGPWTVGIRRKCKVGILANGWANLAKVVVKMHGDERENTVGRANAFLIAAAPELYVALVETLAIAERNEDGEYINRAKMALALARGESGEEYS